MKLIDCHNHSIHSFDSETPIEEMIKSAVSNEISVFAITDHAEAHFDVTAESEISKSVAETNSLKDKYKQIKLLSGFELGQANQDKAIAMRFLDIPNLDFIIGSFHNLPEYKDFYFMDFDALSDKDLINILEKYYKELYDLVKWGKFDSLAHITYPYRYMGKRKVNAQIFDDITTQIFKVIIEKGIALEFNTKSFHTNSLDFNLMTRYLKLYHSLGGKYVTIGSDAHFPCDVGRSISDSYKLLREFGFEYITYFEKRQPKMINIF